MDHTHIHNGNIHEPSMKHTGVPKEYSKHTGHQTESFLRKFWVVLALTIPILAYSEIIERVFGWQAPRFPGYEYVILILASIAFFYGGWIFIVGAYCELSAKLPGMMTL